MESLAQPYLGIVWDVPADTAESMQQLNTFAALGVSHLEMHYPIQPPVLEQLRRFDFTILVRSHYEYLRRTEIQRSQQEMTERYLEIMSNLRSYPKIQYLGLFSHSQSGDKSFRESLKPILDTLSNQYSIRFYEYSGRLWNRIPERERVLGSLFETEGFEPNDINRFNEKFNNLLAANSDEILFLPSGWFLEAISTYFPFTESLANYNQDGNWKIPLPASAPDTTQANWLVLLLLSLWVMLAIQIKYLPYIRPMILRYFLSHRFYVDDILQYRERAATGGILLMILHAVFTGVVGYITAMILLTEAGMQAFFHHLPYLALTGVNFPSFFVLAMMLSFITQLIAIFWIHLPAKNLEHISQCINLYSGVFYLDYLIVTLMITLYVSGIGFTLNLILAGVFMAIWYGAFNLAAMNASRGMGQRRVIYLLLTVGLHTFLSGALVLALLNNGSFLQTLDLAISLP